MTFLFSLLFSTILVWIFKLRPRANILACGLAGYSGSVPVDPIKFKWLLRENMSRGEHSTGVYGNFLHKDNTNAIESILSGWVDEVIEGSKLILGHTRHATMGAKTPENAHPFELDSIVGTHNGLLFPLTISGLCDTWNLPKPDVDSYLIFQILEKSNFDYQALSEIEGAMALAFCRKENPEYLYLYRRESRPLHIGVIKGNLYYSSEATPLFLIGCTGVTKIATHTLYIFKNGGLVEVVPIKKPVILSLGEDESIATWMKTASQVEKKAIGINVSTNTVAMLPAHQSAGNSKTQHFTKLHSDLKSSKTKYSDYNQINLLDGLAEAMVDTIETVALNSPLIGKDIYGGDPNASYILFSLQETRHNLPLVGWCVSVGSSPDICSVSIHNGIGILQIPRGKLDNKLELVITNPFFRDRRYVTKVSLNKPGRVLEVTLRVPFRWEEEKQKEGNGNSAKRAGDLRGEEGIPNVPFKVSSISEKQDLDERLRELPKDLRQRHGRISTRYGNGVDMETTAGQDVNTRINFEHENDYLDMDAWTTVTTAEDLDKHHKEILEALSTTNGDWAKLADTLIRSERLIGRLSAYFNERANKISELHELTGKL